MKSFFLLLTSLLSLNAFSAELKTNYVTFTFSENSLSIDHQETSNSPAYTSIGNKSKVSVFSLKIGVEKEFLADKVLSVTIGAGIGGKYGRVSDSLIVKGIQYRERVSGTSYGFGGSLNGNFYINKMRSQVFGGLQILKSNSLYKITYSPISLTTPATNINYEGDSTQSFLTGGLRFFDEKQALMSFISIDYRVASTFNTKVQKAQVDNASIDLTSNAQITHSPFGFTLGFGLMF